MTCKYCQEDMSLEDSDFCCDNCGATYAVLIDAWTDPVVPKDPNKNWRDNSIQFPRLISEIGATIDFTNKEWNDLCESMDLSQGEINDLFDRAQLKWEAIKNRT